MFSLASPWALAVSLMLISSSLVPHVSGKQNSELLASFGEPVQLFGDMILNDIDFVDGLKLQVYSPTNRTVTVTKNESPLNGTFVTGTTGDDFRVVRAYSYMIKTNQPSSDLIAKVEIPYDPIRLMNASIEQADTYVARLADDKKAWTVVDRQRTVQKAAFKTSMSQMTSIDGEFVILGRQSKAVGNIFVPFGAGDATSANFTGGPGRQDTEFVDGLRFGVQSDRPLRMNVNLKFPISTDQLPQGMMSLNAYAWVINTTFVASLDPPAAAGPGSPIATLAPGGKPPGMPNMPMAPFPTLPFGMSDPRNMPSGKPSFPNMPSGMPDFPNMLSGMASFPNMPSGMPTPPKMSPGAEKPGFMMPGLPFPFGPHAKRQVPPPVPPPVPQPGPKAPMPSPAAPLPVAQPDPKLPQPSPKTPAPNGPGPVPVPSGPAPVPTGLTPAPKGPVPGPSPNGPAPVPSGSIPVPKGPVPAPTPKGPEPAPNPKGPVPVPAPAPNGPAPVPKGPVPAPAPKGPSPVSVVPGGPKPTTPAAGSDTSVKAAQIDFPVNMARLTAALAGMKGQGNMNAQDPSSLTNLKFTIGRRELNSAPNVRFDPVPLMAAGNGNAGIAQNMQLQLVNGRLQFQGVTKLDGEYVILVPTQQGLVEGGTGGNAGAGKAEVGLKMTSAASTIKGRGKTELKYVLAAVTAIGGVLWF